ncbi:nitrilase-related carbon-nitrogen hydrolase [Rhodococcus sp. 008]|uniref:nitrilase-related carbon-nitrogen hydrolase n=1 Tax=Rhodococcus sp. 008 TaxID=1723645 RepID=UPI000806299B|nr:nitrilase-related carbon-nitrogen hydrolase [Rhodococcus sp. 008]ANQ69808.1 hydrolase [Rhodococcus sp. 008]
MLTITALTPPESPAATSPSTSTPLRVGLVQHRWHEDQDDLHAELSEGIASAAKLGASVVFLPELTLSRYPASTQAGDNPGRAAEDLLTGPTFAFATKAAAENQVLVHASLYERSDAEDGLGFNTAILVSPGGELLGRTRKLHIPVTAGYYEDTYFRGGPSEDAYPVHEALGAKFGLPTCWDEWFPEVARAYSLAGAQVLVYPTAIGSEPDHPNFDTQPLWQQVIVGNGIANGTFMVVPNRHGSEGLITFYGSSFISDPYGRILVQAPRDESAVLVADLDLQHREDWLALFPFLATRRPDTYSALTAPVNTAGANR